MVAKRTLSSQLQKIRFKKSIFVRKEIVELKRLLQPGESVLQCSRGYYQGGSGLLVVTDSRVILIDKQPFYLNLEEIKYDSITHVSVESRFLHASLTVRSGRKVLQFRSIQDARIKHAAEIIDSLSSDTVPVKRIERTLLTKPYLDPRWRPRHTVILPKSRPTKFTGATLEQAM